MKKYVIDENAKEKLIETEDYTREELKELIYGTVYDANVDALSEEELSEIIDGVEEELIEITREAEL